EFIKKIKDACNSKNSRDRAKKIKKTGLDLTKQNKENLRYLAKSRGKTQRDVLNELVESAYNQTRNQEIQLNSSFLNQDAFFDSIPQTQPSSSQSENNEEKLIPNQTSRIEDKEERSRLYDTDSAISSIYDNEKLPTGTPTPKQEARSLQTFLPEENYGKQIKDAGTVNTDSYHKL
ncbi:MAG: putative DNA-binding protein, partial [Psychrobacter glaciei]